MSARILRGIGAAGGVAVGAALAAWRVEEPPASAVGGPAEEARALVALERLAQRLGGLAGSARRAGRTEVADVLDASRLIALDPVLARDVRELAATRPAIVAVREATERHADRLAALEDPKLAALAADVRGVGRRAAGLLAGGGVRWAPDRPTVLLARDLSVVDVAELELSVGEVRGVALVDGTVASHVTIMARSLGLPMAVAVGEGLLQIAEGEEVIVDGDTGVVVTGADEDLHRDVVDATDRALRLRTRLAGLRHLPATTPDGRRVALRCNASTEAEVEVGLRVGAEGVGLLRSEMAFLDATEWPSEADHLAFVESMVVTAARAPVTVRTLDFGADKRPPFLAGSTSRGLALTLERPAALAAQLRAILRAGVAPHLRVLLPYVEAPVCVTRARELLQAAADETRWSGPLPPLGAMIETVEGVERVEAIALAVDFLSIGTNDLVASALGAGRDLPPAAAADPAVLALVQRVVQAARRTGRRVGVCGEAAGEPAVAVLLVGLGVDELSVSPALVDAVRATVHAVHISDAQAAAEAALVAGSAAAALAAAEELLSAELRQHLGEPRDRLRGILA